MKLVIISGRSGSGKSTALHVLEDIGFYCIDNIPAGILPSLVKEMGEDKSEGHSNIAASIDARNLPNNLKNFPRIISKLDKENIDYSICYLDANDKTILTRFSATRRKHPLSNDSTSLEEAISIESELLDPIATLADLKIDTSNLTLHQLRDIIVRQLAKQEGTSLALLFESFGFKHGVPSDADIVFDVRCLPNPYWNASLREYTGQHEKIAEFLENEPDVKDMLNDICLYLDKWLPRFEANNRSYMTVAIGCTGGQHRSVYLAEQLTRKFAKRRVNVQTRHRELV
jgi:UPF0042 nucleotide-binding protein